MLDDDARERVLSCLLVSQRHSWEQGLTAAVLEERGATGALRALVDDAVARQLPDGRLGELDPACAVNSGALLEFVTRGARDRADERLAAAARRQTSWLLRGAPRASDGTLYHLTGSRQVWADTVAMVVPALAAAGASGAALAQLTGHRRRLRRPGSGLWVARWDDDAGAPADPRAWGTGNGWVAAGLARALRHLPRGCQEIVAREVRDLLDACLPYRRPDGLFGDVLDDPAGPADTDVAAMLAFAALEGASEGWLPAGYGPVGEDLLGAVVPRVDALGRVAGASAAPHFDHPGHSPEAQAFPSPGGCRARPVDGPLRGERAGRLRVQAGPRRGEVAGMPGRSPLGDRAPMTPTDARRTAAVLVAAVGESSAAGPDVTGLLAAAAARATPDLVGDPALAAAGILYKTLVDPRPTQGWSLVDPAVLAEALVHAFVQDPSDPLWRDYAAFLTAIERARPRMPHPLLALFSRRSPSISPEGLEGMRAARVALRAHRRPTG